MSLFLFPCYCKKGLLSVSLCPTTNTSMGRTPKGRITVAMEEAEISAEGLILPSHLIKSNVGLVIQSGISLVQAGSRVALDENQSTEVMIEDQWYVSARESSILMINT